MALALRRASFVFVLSVIALLSTTSAQASARTVVSLTFDDGAANQRLARDQLYAHRMHGTFYIDSGKVGDNKYYMDWGQVATLPAYGQEVGGHTIDHPHLTQLNKKDATREICDDRTALKSHGFDPVSFAYPFGDHNSSVDAIVAGCGYKSARRVGGLSHGTCSTCEDAESLPPDNAFALRSNAAHNGQITLSELEGYVTQAEDAGGGWIPLTFHDICDIPCDGQSVDESTSVSDFVAFLDWLRAREASGTVVMSVRAVMGLGEPAFPPDPPPAPVTPAPAPAAAAAAPEDDHATAFASLELRPRRHLRGPVITASLDEPGRIRARGAIALGRKTYHFRAKAADAAPGVTVKLRLSLTRKGRRAVRRALGRALRRHRHLLATVTVTAKDAAGNVHTEVRTVRIRR